MSDSQCTGELFKGETDYTVTWVPHPVVKLSSNTKVEYEKYNGSFIRGMLFALSKKEASTDATVYVAPVCESTRDYVDLDISGESYDSSVLPSIS